MSSWRLVLAWETGQVEDEGGVPQEFVPTEPADIRIYAMDDYARSRALAARMGQLRNQNQDSVHRFRIPYSEVASGYVYVYGRSYDEARVQVEHYQYVDMETTDSDNFELYVHDLEIDD